jgi:hypothetical protein
MRGRGGISGNNWVAGIYPGSQQRSRAIIMIGPEMQLINAKRLYKPFRTPSSDLGL